MFKCKSPSAKFLMDTLHHKVFSPFFVTLLKKKPCQNILIYPYHLQNESNNEFYKNQQSGFFTDLWWAHWLDKKTRKRTYTPQGR